MSNAGLDPTVLGWGNVTQFVPPDGRRVDIPFPLETGEVSAAYEVIRSVGVALELERLSIGRWSLTLSDSIAEDDYKIEFVNEGPDDKDRVKEAFYRMILSFDPAKHSEWRAMHMDAEFDPEE